jgi:asparagine synthase (glutamine-hydrolysing)
MCGFAAAINWPEAAATVDQLIEGLWHRGDVTDPLVQVAPYTALCTRRLRIVDSERAIQPQVSCDGRIIVSFNGQIYNHAILRDEMIALGVRFQTESDTEVLVNALSVWGPQALERLSGMYAFVAVDIDSGGFLAARDPFGIKPLYVIQSGAGFLFCSEMKPLLDTVADGD